MLALGLTLLRDIACSNMYIAIRGKRTDTDERKKKEDRNGATTKRDERCGKKRKEKKSQYE